MAVYASILTTIDCSPVDEAILEQVEALARQNGAQVTLLHVVHSHTRDQDRVLREKAEAHLDGHVERLRARGVEARARLRTGEPEEEILAEIDAGNYDLVAMATHGHGFLGDLLFGSVSRTLKHRLRLPLLLVQAPRGKR